MNFGINRNWPMMCICICYCDHMWYVDMFHWGVWTCMPCLWEILIKCWKLWK